MVAEPDTQLCQVDRPEAATALQHALTAASVPYRVLTAGEALTVFFVPVRHLDRAQAIAEAYLFHGEFEPSFDDDDIDASSRLPAPPFPWAAVQAVAATVMLHSGLLFWAGGSLPSGAQIYRYGAITRDSIAGEPWRLFTAMFLHADLGHVLWNGLSMLVFAVPVAAWIGIPRAGLVYVSAGVAGGLATAWLGEPGVPHLGSSGAVAGLFGAWIVLRVRRAVRDDFPWRAHVLTLGIALLVLPTLFGPLRSGHVVPVASHLTGALVGMLAAAQFSSTSSPRPGSPPMPLTTFTSGGKSTS